MMDQNHAWIGILLFPIGHGGARYASWIVSLNPATQSDIAGADPRVLQLVIYFQIMNGRHAINREFDIQSREVRATAAVVGLVPGQALIQVDCVAAVSS